MLLWIEVCPLKLGVCRCGGRSVAMDASRRNTQNIESGSRELLEMTTLDILQDRRNNHLHPSSTMRPCSVNVDWSGFSGCDRTSAQFVAPCYSSCSMDGSFIAARHHQPPTWPKQRLSSSYLAYVQLLQIVKPSSRLECAPSRNPPH